MSNHDIIDELADLDVCVASLADWLDDEDDVNSSDDLFPLHVGNVDGLRVIISTWTQWRVVAGFNGLIYLGIDYNVLDEVWKRLNIKKKDRDEIFSLLPQIESALLPIRNKTKNNNEPT